MNKLNNLISSAPSTPRERSHGSSADGRVLILVDLLRGISPLASEESAASL
jgi:hypothetical protein